MRRWSIRWASVAVGGALFVTFASWSLADARHGSDPSARWHILINAPPPALGDDALRIKRQGRGIDAVDPWSTNPTPEGLGGGVDGHGKLTSSAELGPSGFHRQRSIDTVDPWTAEPLTTVTPALSRSTSTSNPINNEP